ncbi:hypothetical protein Hanom_Chr11g00997851 [Helianthus anomalus]
MVKLLAAEAALLKIPKSRSGDDLDFNELMEIEGAKLKLLELSNKKKWPKPNYRYDYYHQLHCKRFNLTALVLILELSRSWVVDMIKDTSRLFKWRFLVQFCL